jgi:hypothetical protein
MRLLRSGSTNNTDQETQSIYFTLILEAALAEPKFFDMRKRANYAPFGGTS